MNYNEELNALKKKGNLRTMPPITQKGKWIRANGREMLNLSSNDYLGLTADEDLYRQFTDELCEEDRLLSASSSRLLTGNSTACQRLEKHLSEYYGTESALVLSSGYQMNAGILPAVADSRTLILADKLVHASLIDGIRLSAARTIRFRHQDYDGLERLIHSHANSYEQIIVVTESIFSMDGDVTDLKRLTSLKRSTPNLMIYVDEAHAVGVRGETGLGVAEEQGCAGDIDFLCGTFGKAMASVGAFVVCRNRIKDYLVNKMRTLIFTTALPPINLAWTDFLFARLAEWGDRRKHLASISGRLNKALAEKGYPCVSNSHIIPLIVGESEKAILKATGLQAKGFYVLPVRPPTVPEGTSRLRFSLRADLSEKDLDLLIQNL